eukprot:SAG31_NODE_1462_length_8242_cov_5.541135_7_plen_220_part_00
MQHCSCASAFFSSDGFVWQSQSDARAAAHLLSMSSMYSSRWFSFLSIDHFALNTSPIILRCRSFGPMLQSMTLGSTVSSMKFPLRRRFPMISFYQPFDKKQSTHCGLGCCTGCCVHCMHMCCRRRSGKRPAPALPAQFPACPAMVQHYSQPKTRPLPYHAAARSAQALKSVLNRTDDAQLPTSEIHADSPRGQGKLPPSNDQSFLIGAPPLTFPGCREG